MTFAHIRTNAARSSVLLFAVAQLGAMSVVPVVDSILDGREASTPLHVESENSSDCGAHHDHLFCQVARSLTDARSASGSEAGLPVLWGSIHGLADGPNDFIPPADCHRCALGPRAPPSA